MGGILWTWWRKLTPVEGVVLEFFLHETLAFIISVIITVPSKVHAKVNVKEKEDKIVKLKIS